MASNFDIGVTAYSPLARGTLSGKYLKKKKAKEQRRIFEKSPLLRNERNIQVAQAVLNVADDMGCIPSQVAINWIRKKSRFIIPNCRSTNIKSNEREFGLFVI